MPSQRASSVTTVADTAASAKHRPTSAPRSSSSTTGSSGCLERRMKPHQLMPGSLAPGLDDRGAERGALEHDGDEQDPDGDRRRLELVGVADLRDALVDREHAAQAEQDEGHHERPEVAFASVAERVLGGRCPAGALLPQQEERLVAGVGHGVHGLGQHRRRAREQEPPRTGDGDAQVGEQRGHHRPGSVSAAGHGGRVLRCDSADHGCSGVRHRSTDSSGGLGARPGPRSRPASRGADAGRMGNWRSAALPHRVAVHHLGDPLGGPGNERIDDVLRVDAVGLGDLGDGLAVAQRGSQLVGVDADGLAAVRIAAARRGGGVLGARARRSPGRPHGRAGTPCVRRRSPDRCDPRPRRRRGARCRWRPGRRQPVGDRHRWSRPPGRASGRRRSAARRSSVEMPMTSARSARPPRHGAAPRARRRRRCPPPCSSSLPTPAPAATPPSPPARAVAASVVTAIGREIPLGSSAWVGRGVIGNHRWPDSPAAHIDLGITWEDRRRAGGS